MIISRRRTALVAGLLSAVLGLSACGSDSGGSDGGAAGGSSAGYPVSVTTDLGKVTLTKKPERIVVVGSPLDADILAALGQPADVYGFGKRGEQAELESSPWLTSRSYGKFQAGLVNDSFGPDREKIAEQRPDLIVFFGAGVSLDEAGFKELSQVAPTYAYRSVPTWRTALSRMGALVGERDRAAQLSRTIAGEFAQARAKLPGLQGKTFFHGVATPNGIYAVPAAAQLFRELGLKPAANQPVPPARPQTFSAENLDEVTADVVFLGGSGAPRTALEKDPRFAQLPSTKTNSMIFLQPLLQDVAIPSQLAPASVPWLLERLVPQLQKSASSSGK